MITQRTATVHINVSNRTRWCVQQPDSACRCVSVRARWIQPKMKRNQLIVKSVYCPFNSYTTYRQVSEHEHLPLVITHTLQATDTTSGTSSGRDKIPLTLNLLTSPTTRKSQYGYMCRLRSVVRMMMMMMMMMTFQMSYVGQLTGRTA